MDTSSQGRIYIAGLTLLQLANEHLGRSSIQLSIFRTVNCIIFSFLTLLNFANYFCIDANMYIKNAESSLAVVHVSNLKLKGFNKKKIYIICFACF